MCCACGRGEVDPVTYEGACVGGVWGCQTAGLCEWQVPTLLSEVLDSLSLVSSCARHP